MSEPSKKLPQRSKSFTQYSGMAAQMGITIFLGVWGGMKLDEKFPNRFHAFTLSLSLIAVSAAIYLAIKDLLR